MIPLPEAVAVIEPLDCPAVASVFVINIVVVTPRQGSTVPPIVTVSIAVQPVELCPVIMYAPGIKFEK